MSEAPETSTMDALLASKRRIGSMILPSTGGKVYFLSMSGLEHHRVVMHNAQHPNSPMPDAEIAAMCLCEKNGDLLFKDIGVGIATLQGRDSCDLRELSMNILIHSRIPTTLKEGEDLEKKS